MNLLSDIITYMRRILKTPSDAVITDNLLIDYINRFAIMDIPAIMQLFDFKTKYQFQTQAGFDKYNMPLYTVQTEGGQTVGPYPVYQGFLGPAYINGIQVSFDTLKSNFYNTYPNVVQQLGIVATGDGGDSYTFNIPLISNINSTPLNIPIQYLIRGHVDVTGIIDLYNSPFGAISDPPVVTSDQAVGTTGSIASIATANAIPAVYFTSNAADGSTIQVSDSGQFLSNNQNYGLLMTQGQNPFGNTSLTGGYSATITGASQASSCVLTATNSFSTGQFVIISGVIGMTELNGGIFEILSSSPTSITIDVDSTNFTAYSSGGIAVTNVVDYYRGTVAVTFPQPIPQGVNISAQCYLFQTGLPRAILYNNNTIELRTPPDQSYLVELDAYLSPCAFFNTTASIPFGYMAEYIARGAARKVMIDTGDIEQLNFYEPFFKEQESFVWKRSQRQFTSTRTPTIYSQGLNSNNGSGFFNLGSSGL